MAYKGRHAPPHLRLKQWTCGEIQIIDVVKDGKEGLVEVKEKSEIE